MSFSITKTVDLSEFGWPDCSIKLLGLSYKEAKALQDKYLNVDPKDKKTQGEVFDLVASKFVSGTAQDDKNTKVELTKDTLEELPLEVFLACLDALVGGKPSPN